MKRIVSSGPGLLIAIPTLGRPVPLSWAMAFKALNPPINYNVNFSILHGLPVAQARNEFAKQALANGNKYLFFLGDDVEVPAHTLRQLIFRMENNPKLGVVGGVYFSKGEPPAPLIFKENGRGSYWDWKVGEYFPVTGMGMDCTLIRTEVFAKLTGEPFKTVDTDQFLNAVNKADQWTEDLYFLHRVIEETDYEVYVDCGIICKHWDVYSNKAWSLPNNSLPTRKLVAEKSLKAIDIGAGETDRSGDYPDYSWMRVDIREEVNPDYRCDVSCLPFADESFDLVFSSHVLEHINRATHKDVLYEWCRLIKRGGKIHLVLPNIEWAAERVMKKEIDHNVLNVLYGAQSNPYDFHYNGLTPDIVIEMLTTLGFKSQLMGQQDFNMFIEGVKL